MTAADVAELSVPLRTLDPADADLSDLEPLRDLVGDARVVSLGESAHYGREFVQFRHRALRFLVRELGFTAFVLESGFAEGLAVDAWVRGGPGNVADVAHSGMTYRFGDSAEMHDQLRWMRVWNAGRDRPLRYYGMDVPGSAASPGPAVRACVDRIGRRRGDEALVELTDLGGQMEAVARYRSMPEEELERMRTGIAALVERAEASGDEVAYRCAWSAHTLAGTLPPGGMPPEGRNPRDELMADTVRWILEREPRVVVAAHNGHIMRTPFSGLPMLGGMLAAELGDDVVVIGTTYGSGRLVHLTPGGPSPLDWEVSLDELDAAPGHTVDALLAGVGRPLHLVDLRSAPADLLAGATAMLVQHDAVDQPEAGRGFDALVHFARVDTVEGAYETLRGEITAARELLSERR